MQYPTIGYDIQILDMISKYIMRKAFAVWLQAVGSESALQRLQEATGSPPTILE